MITCEGEENLFKMWMTCERHRRWSFLYELTWKWEYRRLFLSRDSATYFFFHFILCLAQREERSAKQSVDGCCFVSWIAKFLPSGIFLWERFSRARRKVKSVWVMIAKHSSVWPLKRFLFESQLIAELQSIC